MKNSKSITVSIIMATYNRAHFIVESLQSIQKQTFTDWECLIIDDGSTDSTKEILRPYLLKDPRFNYYERTKDHKKGLPGCRNQGLELAKEDYIIFFDDDDIVHPENLKICIEVLSDKDLYFCRYDKEPFGGEWKPDALKHDSGFTSKFVDINDLEDIVIGKLPFASCTVMWKKECFEDNRFKEELLYAEEWECYTRILSTGIKGISIDKVLYYNRKHPNSNTGEYYANDTIRVNSKKLAVQYLVRNLSDKNLLTPILLKYFISLAISFRDEVLLNDILVISETEPKNKLYFKFKFYSFPLWKIYKRMNKILIKK